MILVLLTLFIALSIVFILSRSRSMFSINGFFAALSGTPAFTVLISLISIKSGLYFKKMFIDFFKIAYTGINTGLANCLSRKVVLFNFSSIGSGS
jgi:hypothetical protein